MESQYGDQAPILRAAEALLASNDAPLIAVDGRSGSGKSQLAQALGEALNCPVFHMDDFFLPPALRTEGRLAQPGGNIHYERVLAELLEPLIAGAPVSFRPWDCRRADYGSERHWTGGGPAIVEGSYALHPALRDCYTLQVFLTCSPETQRARLLSREGQVRLQMFLTQWIPLEEVYFAALRLPTGCDFLLDTSELERRERILNDEHV